MLAKLVKESADVVLTEAHEACHRALKDGRQQRDA
jgi:hypothetical protein